MPKPTTITIDPKGSIILDGRELTPEEAAQFVHHVPVFMPARGDAVEAWLKAQRDACFGHASTHNVVDGLLDEYRLHADTGTPLHEHACEPFCGCKESGR